MDHGQKEHKSQNNYENMWPVKFGIFQIIKDQTAFLMAGFGTLFFLCLLFPAWIVYDNNFKGLFNLLLVILIVSFCVAVCGFLLIIKKRGRQSKAKGIVIYNDKLYYTQFNMSIDHDKIYDVTPYSHPMPLDIDGNNTVVEIVFTRNIQFVTKYSKQKSLSDMYLSNPITTDADIKYNILSFRLGNENRCFYDFSPSFFSQNDKITLTNGIDSIENLVLIVRNIGTKLQKTTGNSLIKRLIYADIRGKLNMKKGFGLVGWAIDSVQDKLHERKISSIEREFMQYELSDPVTGNTESITEIIKSMGWQFHFQTYNL
jgi:hypothetical protein